MWERYGVGIFVGISETPEGLQKQIEKAPRYTRKWRVTANVTSAQ